MPFPQIIKELAHRLDPLCWESYSGRPPQFKRAVDARRNDALDRAVNSLLTRPPTQPEPAMPNPQRHPILKLQMMLHFTSSIKPFAPEELRTSAAYTRHVKTLLREGLIERPSKKERRQHPGWAYRATQRGRAYVEALRRISLPELVEVQSLWVVPNS